VLWLSPLEPKDQISRLAQWVIQVVDWPLERSVFLQWRSSEGCESGASVLNGEVCRPVRSFSKVARQVRIKDEDGRHSVVPSGLSQNLPRPSE